MGSRRIVSLLLKITGGYKKFMSTWSGLILAAGKGTRMRSRIPKVLHTILGKPLISFAIETVQKLSVENINVVVSPDNHPLIKNKLKGSVGYVVQTQPNGTGDALASYFAQVPKTSDHLIIQNGDMPLISEDSIAQLMSTHESQSNVITVLTLNGRAAQDYGRVIRDQAGALIRIEEAADSSVKQDDISEVNAGVYCIDIEGVKSLMNNLNDLNTEESYITSLVELAYKEGKPVGTSELHSPLEIFGVNDRIQLSNATEILQEQIINKRRTSSTIPLTSSRSDTGFYFLPFPRTGRRIDSGGP